MANTDTRLLPIDWARVTATLTTSESSPRVQFAGPARGAITGLRGDLASTGGTCIVTIYRDNTLDDVLARVTLDFTTYKSDGAQFSQPVPFFEAPYWTVQGNGTSDTKAFGLTLEVRAVQ